MIRNKFGGWLRPVVLLLLLLVAGGSILKWQETRATAEIPSASLIPLLSKEDSSGFARATEPGDITFPRDLGPHEDYQTEWWYYTGNLETVEGRSFGYQLTFFRRALTPDTKQLALDNGRETSRWRTNQVYLAHFTVSDITSNVFYPAEKFSRGAAGLAGAQATPYRVWLEDWSVEKMAPGVVKLEAQHGSVALDLTLTETRPPILHGDEGLSVKGTEPGNASYYYSLVHMDTTGSVTIHNSAYDVTGLSWKDHEYSTGALSPGAIGWDWFSLQLEDGSALMIFQIRREDGTLEPASSGSFIHADGTVEHLTVEDWQLSVLDTWTSPTNGADYPAGWRITIPKVDVNLTGQPLMADQELNVSTTYWEGATEFKGKRQGQPISGRGYVELTGYAEPMTGRL